MKTEGLCDQDEVRVSVNQNRQRLHLRQLKSVIVAKYITKALRNHVSWFYIKVKLKVKQYGFCDFILKTCHYEIFNVTKNFFMGL